MEEIKDAIIANLEGQIEIYKAQIEIYKTTLDSVVKIMEVK